MQRVPCLRTARALPARLPSWTSPSGLLSLLAGMDRGGNLDCFMRLQNNSIVCLCWLSMVNGVTRGERRRTHLRETDLLKARLVNIGL